MDCCHRAVTANQFDTAIARHDLRRFRRRGPEPSTRHLLRGVLERALPPQASLLDIGGGIGVIHRLLLDRGFGHAIHVDASDAYLSVAADEARRLGHVDRVRFQLAEFPVEAAGVPAADVVTLDRVVCCDPDYVRMLSAAASRARHVLAFSYPRPRLLTRLMVGAANGWRRLIGRAFRAYVHPPHLMKAVLENAGMRHAWSGGSWVWAVEVFERV
ncbi:MAG TPA: methyltransferase domain-containing protein [Gemmatimonadales bacterium]|nr:methyltransferase domain-containing protein [Gemmatimonadales bacterium]